MFYISPLSRGALILSFGLVFMFVPQVPGHAEEMGPACKGLRGKELVLCWKKMDPQRARGDHDVWHREQNTLHLQWHQEHRGMTDAQVTINHQKFHQDMTKKHQEFHRGATVQEKTKKEVTAPANLRDAKTAPNKGLSKKRQLRQGE